MTTQPQMPPTQSTASGKGARAARRPAAIVGALFIVATVAGGVSVALLGSTLDAPDLLASVHANESQVLAAVVADLILVLAVVAIPILLFPYLRQHREGVARGYFAARMIEGIVILAGALSLLMLVTVSRESVEAAASIVPGLPAAGAVLLGARDWTDLVGTQLVFGVTALILNYSFYRSRLVPRFISVWGFIGAVLVTVSSMASVLFGLDPFSTISIVLFLPIAVNEMVLAVWLIVRGFNSSAIAPESAST